MYMSYGWPQVIPLESGLCPSSQRIVYLKVLNCLLLIVSPSHLELSYGALPRLTCAGSIRGSPALIEMCYGHLIMTQLLLNAAMPRHNMTATTQPSVPMPSDESLESHPAGTSEAENIVPSSTQTRFKLFSKQFLELAKEAHHREKFDMIMCSQQASEWWNDMSTEERAPYNDKARCERALWKTNQPVAPKRKHAKPAFLTRCSPSMFRNNAVLRLTPNQMVVVRRIGFGSLLDLQCATLPREFILHLLPRFDPDTCCLDLGNGRIVSVTTADVTRVLGIQPSRCSVPTFYSDDVHASIRARYQTSGSNVTLSDLQKVMASGETGEHFIEAFILFTLGCFLCPTTSDSISPRLIPTVSNIKKVSKYNWPKFVLQWLVNEVSSYKRRLARTTRVGGGSVGGCLYFLMDTVRFFETLLAGQRSIIAKGMSHLRVVDDLLMRQGHTPSSSPATTNPVYMATSQAGPSSVPVHSNYHCTSHAPSEAAVDLEAGGLSRPSRQRARRTVRPSRAIVSPSEMQPQATPPTFSQSTHNPVVTATAPPVSEDTESAMGIGASIHSARERLPFFDTHPTSEATSSTSCNISHGRRSECKVHDIQIQNNIPAGRILHETSILVPSAPSTVNEIIADDPILDLPSPTVENLPASAGKRRECEDSSCVICLDAPVEGACVPRGHMAGCMSCLNEIIAKKWDFPVCRAKVNQVIRLYVV